MTVTAAFGSSRTVGPFTPAVRSPFSTILQIAEVREGVAWTDPVDMIDSYNCMQTNGVHLDDCDTWSFTKEWGAPNWTDGTRYVVQGGVQCSSIGFDPNDARIKAAFEVQEANGVAGGLAKGILDNGVDQTPAGGPVTPVQALGVLESKVLCGYAGVPVLHIGVMMANQCLNNGALVKVGNHLETMLGTPVAVSCELESKTGDILDDVQWAYGSGAVTLARSEFLSATELNRGSNVWTVLFERLYLAAVDCVSVKVQVKVL